MIAPRFAGFLYERLRNPLEVFVAVSASWRLRPEEGPSHVEPLVELDIEMFPSFFDAPDGLIPLPEPDEVCVGEHRVVLIGADRPKGVFGFRHLFSADWGRGGEGAVPFEYVDSHTTGATALRWHGGPEPEDSEHETSQNGRVDQRFDETQWRRLVDNWVADGPQSEWLIQHESDDVIWVGRKLVGLGNGDVWIHGAVLVRGVLDDPMLVGWMFCRLVDHDLVDVEEYFVWPPYRGRGFGTALAGRTLLYARATNARWVRWIETADDAIVKERVPTRMPSWASDFIWTPPDATLGWSVARVTTEVELSPLLERLGSLHVDGGVHLLWTDGLVHVAPHGRSPQFSLVLEKDVPTPPPRQPPLS